jgi:hypothetical protein
MRRGPAVRRAAAAALVLLLGSGAAWAQAAGARLSDIVALARAADAQYGAARAAAAAGRERLPQARAGLRPSVAFTHVQRRNRDGSTSYTGGTGSYDASSTSLVLSQPVFRIANVVAVEQAGLQAELVEIQLAFAEQDLLLRVARASVDVLQSPARRRRLSRSSWRRPGAASRSAPRRSPTSTRRRRGSTWRWRRRSPCATTCSCASACSSGRSAAPCRAWRGCGPMRRWR